MSIILGPESTSISPHSWNIPTIRIFLDAFHEYPSVVYLKRIISKDKLIKIFKDGVTIVSEPIVGYNVDKELEPTRGIFFTVRGEIIKFAIHASVDQHFPEDDDETENQGGDNYYYSIRIYYASSTISEKFLKEKIIKPILKGSKEKESLNKLSIVTKAGNDFYLQAFKIKDPEIDFKLNYNEGFEEVDSLIKTRLSATNDKGLVLLHGTPGTGKTMYIRHLINNIKKSQIIYLPPDLVGALATPEFASFLLDYPNSLLLIEDAESAIKERSAHTSQSVSNLLNMADGLLSDALQMQILATFNSELESIDDALLRKGRLIAKYEFKELEVPRAQMLSDKLGFDVKIEKPATLANIYNPEGVDSLENKKESNKSNPIGFGK